LADGVSSRTARTVAACHRSRAGAAVSLTTSR
jgi:hypothetical protein